MNKVVYNGLTFTDDEIVDGEVYQALSLMCDVLEIGTLDVGLYIRDPAVWAVLESFRRNDKLLYYHNDRLVGTYYIESVERTGKYTFSVQANDAIALLEQSSHLGGIYTGQTVEELVADICNIPYAVQTRFSDVKLYGWLPIDTRRANLAQVLFAIGASAKVDQNGTLRVEALWNGTASNIGEDRIFMGDSVTYETKVTEVSVLEHQYIPSTEEMTLFEGTAADGDIIQFSEPAHSLTASGFSILESGANWAKVSAGSGQLNGKKYMHTTRDTRETVTPSDVPNVVEVKDATLVSLVNSAQVVERLAEYYKISETVSHDVVFDKESPGDVVSFKHPYSGDTFGCIKDTTIQFGGRLRSSETVANGYRPKYDSKSVVYDKYEILTGSGEWIPPEGVTKVRAVLIGAGQDGSPGNNGLSTGRSPTDDYDTWGRTGQWVAGDNPGYNPSASASIQSSPYGKGGEGGEPGLQGKVLEVTIELSDRSPISYNCGTRKEDGSVGSDTVFGDKSSSDGGILPNGYTDISTGTQYAAPGKKGVNGGNGGSVGSQGESVAGIPGGYGYSSDSDSDSAQTSTNVTQDGIVRLEITAKGTGSANHGGAGGGGAGGGEEDNPGSAGGSASRPTIVFGGNGIDFKARVNGVVSGKGGDGAKGKDAATYGSSGSGGHGGGGAGATGSASAQASISASVKCVVGSSAATARGIVRAETGGSGGGGGKGGAGGKGMDGCILLYYGQPIVEVSGPVKEKNGRALLDHLGRRIIV